MSRSTKHTPIYKDNTGNKPIAARKIRRVSKQSILQEEDPNLLQNASYKRHFPQWDISDYSFREPDQDEWVKDWLEYHPNKTEKDGIRAYRKWYINK